MGLSGDVLVLGARGMLGGEALEYFNSIAGVRARGLDRRDGEDFAARVAEEARGCEWCVNCAAMTDTAGAETSAEKRQASLEANALLPAKVAKACAAAGAKLVHFSSDYVFGGGGESSPIPDDAVPAPLGVYGMHKLIGEMLVEKEFPRSAVVLRTSWLYGRRNEKSFVHRFTAALAKALAEGRTLQVPDDEVSVPTSTLSLLDAADYAMSCGMRGVLHAVPLLDGPAPSRYDWTRFLGGWFADSWRRRKAEGGTTPAEDAVWSRYGDGSIQKKPGGKTDAWRPTYSAMRVSPGLGHYFKGWKSHMLDFLNADGYGAEWSRRICADAAGAV